MRIVKESGNHLRRKVQIAQLMFVVCVVALAILVLISRALTQSSVRVLRSLNGYELDKESLRLEEGKQGERSLERYYLRYFE